MSETVVYLTDTDFNEKVSQGVSLVDFYADWCGPCRMMTPIIDELSQEMTGQVGIFKFDIEAYKDVPTQFQITSIPTLIIFKDGQEVERIVGLKDKDSLKKLLSKHL